MHFLIAIQGNQIREITDTIVAQSLVLKFNKVIDQKEGKLEIGIKENQSLTPLLTLKVLEFPMIKILWIGVVVMCIGFIMSIVQRIKKLKNYKPKLKGYFFILSSINHINCVIFIICGLQKNIIFIVFILGLNILQKAQAQRGTYDTIKVHAYITPEGDTIPMSYLAGVEVFTRLTPQLRRYWAEWTRLRNAIYVTYPYAISASRIMNDINAKLVGINDRKNGNKLSSLVKKN
jgi:hypothetical protein